MRRQITSGELDRRIAIQQQTTQKDAYGQPQQTWTAVYSCWASIDVQHSAMIYETAEFVSQATYRITIRWTFSQTFNVGDRIQSSEASTGVTHTYEIKSIINPESGNVMLVFLAYELFGVQ